MRDFERLYRAALRDHMDGFVWLAVLVAAISLLVLLPLLGCEWGMWRAMCQ